MYREKVKAKWKELIHELASKYPGVKIPNVKISYSLNSSRTVGIADYRMSTLVLNEGILNEYGDIYINHTVVHEFCHFVVKALYPFGFNSATGKKVMPHGKEFKKVCNAFGIEGKATTGLFNQSKTLQAKKETLNRHFVKCSCQLHSVSTRMYNIVRIGKRPKICRKCRTRLEIASA